MLTAGNGDRRAMFRRLVLFGVGAALGFVIIGMAFARRTSQSPSNNSVPAFPSHFDSAVARELAYEALQIRETAGGYVFPRTLNATSRYTGSWHSRPGFDATSVTPAVVPNRTLVYHVPVDTDMTTRHTAALAGGSGDMVMMLESYPVLDAVLGVQAVRGLLVMFQGSQIDDHPSVVTGVHGKYFPDGGLLFAVGSVTSGDVGFTVPRSPAIPLSVNSSSNKPVAPERNSSDGSNDGSTDGGSRETETGEVGDEGNECILLMALRARPVGFDVSWNTDTSGSASHLRRLSTHAPAVDQQEQMSSEKRQPKADYELWLQRVEHAKTTKGVGRFHGGAFSVLHDFLYSVWNFVPGSVHAAQDRASTPWMLPPRSRTLTSSSEMAYRVAEPHSRASPARISRAASTLSSPLLTQNSATLHRRDPQSGGRVDSARRLLSTTAPQRWLVAGEELTARDADEDDSGFRHTGESWGTHAQPQARRVEAAAVGGVYSGIQWVPMYGHAISPNCNFSMDIALVTTSVDVDLLQIKAVLYNMFVLALGTLLFFSAFHQLVRSMADSVAFRVSLVSVSMQCCMDGCIFVGHVLAALSQPQAIMLGLISSSLLYGSMFAILGFRLMLVVDKATRPALYEGGVAAFAGRGWMLRRRILFVLLVALGLSQLLGLGWIHFLTIVLLSFWVPQIVHSVAHDCRPGVTQPYLWATSIARAALPLYFLLCPSNVLYFLMPPEPHAVAVAWSESMAAGPFDAPFADRPGLPWSALGPNVAPAFSFPARASFFRREFCLGVLLAVWVLLQAVVVFLQGKTGWGPRFFVPAPFLPKRYDYHRVFTVREGRIVPDPLATAAHAAAPSVRRTPAVANTADGDVGAGADRSRMQLAGQAAAEAASAVYRNALWFLNGCRETVIQWRQRLRGQPRRAVLPPLPTQALAPQSHGTGAAVPAVFWTSMLRLPRWLGGASQRYERIAEDASPDAVPAAGAVAPHAPREAESVIGDSSLGAAENGASASAHTAPPASAVAIAAAADPALDEIVGAADAGNIDCVVCMEAVVMPLSRREYMITPCDHLFHTACLAPWLEQRLECPTCRLRLPEPLVLPG